MAATRLGRIVRTLRAFHGEPPAPPTRDAFRLILWEQVGYLADDEKRLAAYRALEARVGLTARAILDAPIASLREIVRLGGAIAVGQRAERLRAVAERVERVWQGSLDAAIRLPLADARRELKKYPAIGEPGAERILLLTGARAVLGLESNAVRVLLRLGYGREDPQWTRTYRAVQVAASDELPETIKTRQLASLLLRHHGQTICRRSEPLCGDCPVVPDCPTGRSRLG